MLGILFTIATIAVIGIIGPLVAMVAESNTYGSKLEEYIVSKNPQDTADVERLAKEYDLAASKRFL